MINLSDCCIAPVHAAFTGPQGLTCWHVCDACGKPCDANRVSDSEAARLLAARRKGSS